MSHRQRVIATLYGQSVDRFPMWYAGDHETTRNLAAHLGVPDDLESVLKALDIDFRTVRPEYIGKPHDIYPDGSCDSIWGIRRGGSYYGQALNHPLRDVQSVKDVENYAWPSVDEWDAKSIRRESVKYSADYAVIGGAWSPFFHDVADLFGMEEMFLRMIDTPEIVEAAIDKCLEFYIRLSTIMFEEMADSLDIFFFGNDFGSQQSLICSPAMWRKFFGPGIKTMIDLGHKYGLQTALHSCGSIREIIPDLIDMGLDIVNPVQSTAAGMDPESLQKEFGDTVVFFGGVDVQHILNDGSVQDVENEVRRMLSIFNEGKGYILAPAHDYLLPEIPPENIVAMYRAGKEGL